MLRSYTIGHSVCAAGALITLLLASGNKAQAQTTIDFEGFSQGTSITNQYDNQGVDFSGAIILSIPNYNSSGYPPHSGSGVVYNADTGMIQASSVGSLWSDVSLWYTAGSGNFNFNAYDSQNNLLTTTSGGNNYGGNSQMSLHAANISYVTITGQPNYFTVDDFAFTQVANVPEPGSWAMLATSGLSGAGFLLRKRRRK